LEGSREKQDLDARKPIEIDRDEFDDVFAKLSVALELDFQTARSFRLSLVNSTIFTLTRSSKGSDVFRIAGPAETA
jgi:hypothetical protein